jgi:hypothetical protein
MVSTSDLANLGISAYDYFQNKKAYDDIIERYRDAIAQNTKATQTASGLVGGAYDTSAGYSKNKYDELMSVLNQTTGALGQQDKNLYKQSNVINQNNLNTQNNQLDKNLNTQNALANKSYGTLNNILGSNYNTLQTSSGNEFNKEKSLYGKELSNQQGVAQQGYDASRKDLSGQYQPAINAYSPYTQGGNNAQSLLSRFLTGDPNTRVADYIKTPGYDFRYNEGMNALDRSASARGNLMTGSAIKEAMRYGQGMAQQGYDNYLNQLSGQSAQGLNATNAQGNLRQAFGTALSNTNTNRANALSNASQNYTTSQSANLNDLYNQLNSNTNNYNQSMIGNVQDLYKTQGQNYGQYSNAKNQNTGTYNQQALNNLENITNANNANDKFGYQEKSGLIDNRYNDLANIIMGKNTNQANLGLQNQGVINDILGKIAQQQNQNTLNTQPLKNVIGSGGNVLGNILGGSSGGSSGGGLGGLFSGLFGGGSFGGSNTVAPIAPRSGGVFNSGGGGFSNSIGSWF